jgi:hypothetical protein
VQVNGRTKIALRGQISNYIPNPTFSVVAKPGAWESTSSTAIRRQEQSRELFGEPMRAIPAFFEPGPPELMNELGLDHADVRHWRAWRERLVTTGRYPRHRARAERVAR